MNVTSGWHTRLADDSVIRQSRQHVDSKLICSCDIWLNGRLRLGRRSLACRP